MRVIYEAPKAVVTVFEMEESIAVSSTTQSVFGTLGLEDIFDCGDE